MQTEARHSGLKMMFEHIHKLDGEEKEVTECVFVLRDKEE